MRMTDDRRGGLGRGFVDRRPETQLWTVWMTVPEPFELLECFLAGTDTVRIVAADLRVAVERRERIQVVRLEVPQQQSI